MDLRILLKFKLDKHIMLDVLSEKINYWLGESWAREFQWLQDSKVPRIQTIRRANQMEMESIQALASQQVQESDALFSSKYPEGTESRLWLTRNVPFRVSLSLSLDF